MMRERVEAIDFFESLAKNADMSQKIYFNDKYAWTEKRGEFIGLVIITDPLKLTSSVKYDYDRQDVTENNDVDMNNALSMFKNRTFICSMSPKEFVESVDVFYDSFAKRQKIICSMSRLNGQIVCNCVPTKKRSLLVSATFNIGEADNDFLISVNLNSLYLVLKHIYIDKSEVFLSTVSKGIVVGCGSETTRFFIYQKSQDDYDKKSS